MATRLQCRLPPLLREAVAEFMATFILVVCTDFPFNFNCKFIHALESAPLWSSSFFPSRCFWDTGGLVENKSIRNILAKMNLRADFPVYQVGKLLVFEMKIYGIRNI